MTDGISPSPRASSAAGLKVPPPPPPSDGRQAPPVSSPAKGATDNWTEAERDALFSELRSLQAQCGSSKYDQAFALITACIDQGINTAGHIIGVLKTLGFDRRHIGSMLTKGKKSYWQRNSDGRYSLSTHHPLMVASKVEAGAIS